MSIVDTPPTARERRRQRTRDDLIEAAIRLIDADGVEAVTIERLVDEAGLARATVYAHFPDGRDGVLRAAYDRAGQDLLLRASGAAASASTWSERILAYARTMIEFSASPTLGRFYSLSGPALVGFRDGGGAGTQGYRARLDAELGAARDAGEIRADADPASLAILLSSSLRDAGITAAHDPDSVERLVGAVGQILDGLRVRS